MTTTEIKLFSSKLTSIAFNMLGSIADAEDVVQDTFLKWFLIDNTQVKNAHAFLQRCVINNCLNFLLKNRKFEQTEDFDHLESERETVHVNIEKESQLQEAWKILLVKLQPLERKVYLLREVFNIEYDVVQDLCNRSSANCRQIFARAKKKIQADFPKISLPSVRMPSNFKKAIQLGFLSEFLDDLTFEILAKAKKS